MAHASLKGLLGKKNETVTLLTKLIDALGMPVGIEDAEGRLLFGQMHGNGRPRFPVMLEGQTLGWVSGGQQAEVIASLLGHLASKEAEKKSLGNEVLSLYRETNLIYDFSEKLGASLEVSAIADATLEQASQFIKASGGAVMLLNEASQVLETVAAFGRGAEAFHGRKLDDSIVGKIAAAGNAEIVNEVPSDARHMPHDPAISSLLCTPFKMKKLVRGVVFLVSETPVAYTAAELKLLIAIASQAALAIENALLHESMVREATRKIEERRRELEIAVQERTAELAKQKENVELLSEIGKELTASLDIDTIFYKLYEHANQLAETTIFGAGLHDPEKALIAYGLVMESGKRLEPYTCDTRDPEQFSVWCIAHRRPVFINDVSTEHVRYISRLQPVAAYANSTSAQLPQSLIYLPLITQDKVLGVITIQSYRKNAYTDYHLNLLQNLAAYTSIALDNADAYRRLDATLQNLKATQQQLVTQEKLASLGQLTAGIAHEIKNPLNFVNNFAMLSIELATELREELAKLEETGLPGEAGKRRASIDEILTTLQQNAEKINYHGKRADGIVKSMMQHARASSHEREPTDLNQLLDDAVNLVYHGLRAQEASFNVAIEKHYDENLGQVQVVPQDISRVFLNIVNNACFAAYQKMKARREGGDQEDKSGARGAAARTLPEAPSFSPTLTVSTKNLGNSIEIRVRDNGNGIPENIREKIFNPFFTTKPTGQGTGLGLSICHDIIVRELKGEIKVETEVGEYAEFVIHLPRN